MSDDLNATANELPGSAYLGRGFNVFGEFALALDGAAVVQQGVNDGGTFTYEGNGKTYNLRSNICTPEPLEQGGGQNIAFSSRSAFREHFSGSVGVSGSIGAFSGHLETTFGGSRSNENEYSWGLVEQHYRGWRVALENTGLLDEEFRSAVNALAPFDGTSPSVVDSYTNFFKRFGTHYISQITCGGHFRYYASISKDHGLSTDEISVNVGAEYDGVMATSKADSKAAWDRCSETWLENRQTHLVYEGYGQFPRVSTPVKYNNQEDAVAATQAAVKQEPVAVGFSLKPLWDLVTDGTSLRQAFDFIMNSRIQIREDVISRPYEQIQGQFAFFVRGVEIFVEPPLLYNMRGLKWAVLDRSTLKVLGSGAIPQDHQFTERDWDAAYETMGGAGLDDTKILLLGFQANVQPALRLSGRLLGLLTAMGADAGLKAWNERADADHLIISYAIIGVPTDQASGIESVYVRPRVPYPRATEPYKVVVDAFLELEIEGGKSRYTPRRM